MSDSADARERFAHLNLRFAEQKARAKAEAVDLSSTTDIELGLKKLEDSLRAGSFDAGLFEERADRTEEMIDSFAEQIDQLRDSDSIDEEALAALSALQTSVDAGMAGSLEDLLARADPDLIAPFENVSVPEWSMAAALISTAGGDQQTRSRALAGIGMDLAKFHRVQDHFMARMQGDTSFQLSIIYSKAFLEAQEKLTARNSNSPIDGSSADSGSSPISFERYAEVSAALNVWSADGQDVNAMLQNEFGYSAAAWSLQQAYWSKKLVAEPDLFQELSKLEDRYRAKYEGVDLDSDLRF